MEHKKGCSHKLGRLAKNIPDSTRLAKIPLLFCDGSYHWWHCLWLQAAWTGAWVPSDLTPSVPWIPRRTAKPPLPRLCDLADWETLTLAQRQEVMMMPLVRLSLSCVTLGDTLGYPGYRSLDHPAKNGNGFWSNVSKKNLRRQVATFGHFWPTPPNFFSPNPGGGVACAMSACHMP